jgi:long-chain acyl-CoA synthetase
MEERDIRGVRTRVWKNAPGSLREVFAESRAHGERTFLVYQEERLTYAQHHGAVVTLARELVGTYGVRKGDRVAVAMRNFPEWSIAFWAAVSVVAVSLKKNAWWTGPELEYGLSDSGSRVLLADDDRARRVSPYLGDLGLRAVIVARSGADLPNGMRRFDDVVGASPPDARLPAVEFDPEDDATIFYTSGTTGKPKGALGTHRNICANLLNLDYARARAELRNGLTPAVLSGEVASEQSATLLSVPFFHVTGCHSVLVASLRAGNKLVLMYKWDPELAQVLIEREGVNMFGGVPSMVWQVLESPSFGTRDLSSVQSIGYGGAPAAPELVSAMGEKFPEVLSSNGYGLTETSSMATANAAADYLRKPDSAGLPVAVCDLKVVDESGREVPTGEVGELWIKGPNIVKGYWNKPEATAATITDGWLHSGDLVRLDEEGFVYIVDRAKDMLIRGGENVYCVEVEDALYGHAAIMDAAVIGLPHHVLGEEVGAAVQVTPGAEVTEEELKAYLRERLAPFKIPVRIDIRREPLPRNPNGKILKRQVKEEMLGPSSS